MNNLNIPLYRGFSKTFNKYILGLPYFSDGRYYMLVDDCNKNNDIGTGSFPIDETTLSINFPDMTDSQGNKIFASLREDGKGGDITELQVSSGTCLSCGDKLPKTLAVAIYEEMEFREIELNPHKCFTKREHNYVLIGNLEYKKVIGIQK